MNLLGKNIAEYFRSLLIIKTKWLTIILPLFILGAFFLSITLNTVHTENYDIHRFNRSKKPIRSQKTSENETETNRKTQKTVTTVEAR